MEVEIWLENTRYEAKKKSNRTGGLRNFVSANY